MKKLYLATIISLLILSSTAKAETYAGVEIQHNSLSLKTRPISLSGGSYQINESEYYNEKSIRPAIFIGTKLTDYADIELTYSYISTSKTNNNTGFYLISNGSQIGAKSDLKIHNLGLDFKPYVKSDKTKLYGILGLNLINATIKEDYVASGYSASEKETKTGAGFSVGAGVEYELRSDIALRLQAKYTKSSIDFNKTVLKSIDNIVTVGAGLLIKF